MKIVFILAILLINTIYGYSRLEIVESFGNSPSHIEVIDSFDSGNRTNSKKESFKAINRVNANQTQEKNSYKDNYRRGRNDSKILNTTNLIDDLNEVNDSSGDSTIHKKKQLNSIRDIRANLRREKEDRLHNGEQQKEIKSYKSEANSSKIKEEQKGLKREGSRKKNLPKLVIIIDDITYKHQLNAVKSLPYHITPSIFPPNKMNLKTYKLAKNLKHYMVHLPLESYSKQLNKMQKTIFTTDSYSKMRDRVKEIRRLFPNAKYINNHTGSKFSKNYKASKRLYRLLLKNGFTFVDSRTTTKSTFKRIAKEFNQKYLQCHLFIDNKKDVNYTINQIKKGVNIAKRRGFAIIIGHPHKSTIEAIRKSKNSLSRVEVLYIDEIK